MSPFVGARSVTYPPDCWLRANVPSTYLLNAFPYSLKRVVLGSCELAYRAMTSIHRYLLLMPDLK